MNFVIENWGLILLAAVSGGLLLWPTLMRGRGQGFLGTAAATRLINDGAMILDVREPAEFSAGHLPNAKLIPVGEIDQRAAELSSKKPILVVCASGQRAAKAAAALRKAGHEQVFCLEGGLSAWRSAGLPVVR